MDNGIGILEFYETFWYGLLHDHSYTCRIKSSWVRRQYGFMDVQQYIRKIVARVLRYKPIYCSDLVELLRRLERKECCGEYGWCRAEHFSAKVAGGIFIDHAMWVGNGWAWVHDERGGHGKHDKRSIVLVDEYEVIVEAVVGWVPLVDKHYQRFELATVYKWKHKTWVCGKPCVVCKSEFYARDSGKKTCKTCQLKLARLDNMKIEAREIRNIINGLANALEKQNVTEDHHQRTAQLPVHSDEKSGSRQSSRSRRTQHRGHGKSNQSEHAM
jgi:hypothetical protein